MMKNIILATLFLFILYFGIINLNYSFILIPTYLMIIPLLYFSRIKEEMKVFELLNFNKIKFWDWIKLLICSTAAVNMIILIELSNESYFWISFFFLLKVVLSIEAIWYLVIILSNKAASHSRISKFEQNRGAIRTD